MHAAMAACEFMGNCAAELAPHPSENAMRWANLDTSSFQPCPKHNSVSTPAPRVRSCFQWPIECGLRIAARRIAAQRGAAQRDASRRGAAHNGGASWRGEPRMWFVRARLDGGRACAPGGGGEARAPPGSGLGWRGDALALPRGGGMCVRSWELSVHTERNSAAQRSSSSSSRGAAQRSKKLPRQQ